ncbi:uncharacterized protein GLRG_01955 [Colletotrichum graminicola M1.001]|uniref:Uncharacterized protein n=1 Tax=Colletotrichum graminicola (strain M1.001 / M2 / FGSC 10212) TaxID=645133 RepID=E3Q8U6_COLGM|nr:uncharacterized protein GLRG_01955 [Colletotrichum graminicola M1.001]EFQ27460.1 hypothetical protein GLRG_01955 [Colletotrichum graminicola M1.001]
MGDGSMVYESETINGRVVNYRDAGPPTFQWDEVRPEAGHGWAGHAIYAAYNDEIKEQEEVPDDNEWSRSLREVESHYVLYEQWHNQNPPPESHDENRQDLRAAAGGEATR